jgi:hypothetical protein
MTLGLVVIDSWVVARHCMYAQLLQTSFRHPDCDIPPHLVQIMAPLIFPPCGLVALPVIAHICSNMIFIVASIFHILGSVSEA